MDIDTVEPTQMHADAYKSTVSHLNPHNSFEIDMDMSMESDDSVEMDIASDSGSSIFSSPAHQATPSFTPASSTSGSLSSPTTKVILDFDSEMEDVFETPEKHTDSTTPTNTPPPASHYIQGIPCNPVTPHVSKQPLSLLQSTHNPALHETPTPSVARPPIQSADQQQLSTPSLTSPVAAQYAPIDYYSRAADEDFIEAQRLAENTPLPDHDYYSRAADEDFIEAQRLAENTPLPDPDYYSRAADEDFIEAQRLAENTPLPDPDYYSRAADEDFIEAQRLAENTPLPESDDTDLGKDPSADGAQVAANTAVPTTTTTSEKDPQPPVDTDPHSPEDILAGQEDACRATGIPEAMEVEAAQAEAMEAEAMQEDTHAELPEEGQSGVYQGYTDSQLSHQPDSTRGYLDMIDESAIEMIIANELPSEFLPENDGTFTTRPQVETVEEMILEPDNMIVSEPHVEDLAVPAPDNEMSGFGEETVPGEMGGGSNMEGVVEGGEETVPDEMGGGSNMECCVEDPVDTVPPVLPDSAPADGAQGPQQMVDEASPSSPEEAAAGGGDTPMAGEGEAEGKEGEEEYEGPREEVIDVINPSTSDASVTAPGDTTEPERKSTKRKRDASDDSAHDAEDTHADRYRKCEEVEGPWEEVIDVINPSTSDAPVTAPGDTTEPERQSTKRKRDAMDDSAHDAEDTHADQYRKYEEVEARYNVEFGHTLISHFLRRMLPETAVQVMFPAPRYKEKARAEEAGFVASWLSGLGLHGQGRDFVNLAFDSHIEAEKSRTELKDMLWTWYQEHILDELPNYEVQLDEEDVDLLNERLEEALWRFIDNHRPE